MVRDIHHTKRLAHSMTIILMVMLFVMVCSCQKEKTKAMENPQRSVYFWRTTFSLDSTEQSFLNNHRIKRMYLHLFDVVNRDGRPMPDATMEFKQQPPKQLDIVPVVFINKDVITTDTTKANALAELIVQRVTKMMELNNLSWHELQIDFDWTKRNQNAYFSMLQAMRKILTQERQRSLSATIRLHQLTLATPPVDYGALMVYNIGKYNDSYESNSILSLDNLRPYLTYLAAYPLPLATALPVYSWDLAFQKDKFIGIARGINLNDTTKYYHVPDTQGKSDIYLVRRYHVATNDAISLLQPGLPLLPGYIIRHEECTSALLQQTSDAMKHERSNILDEVILYHLDNNNLKKYNYEEIENLLGGN